MPVVNSGSIADFIASSINPLYPSVSGNLPTIVNTQVFFVSNFVGDSSLSSSSIAEKYQSPITDLSMANTIKLMAIQDLGVKSVTVEGLSTDNANLTEMAKQFEEKGMIQLKSLTKSLSLYKARG